MFALKIVALVFASLGFVFPNLTVACISKQECELVLAWINMLILAFMIVVLVCSL